MSESNVFAAATARGAVDLSAIIVNYRTEDYVARCLRALPAAAASLTLEIVVVDNSPGALKPLLAERPDVVLIENHQNVGFARACNQGIERARGKAVLLLNPDTEPAEGSLVALTRALIDDARAAVTAARLVYPDGTLQPSCRPFPSVGTALLDCFGVSTSYPRPPLLGRLRVGIWGLEGTRPVAQPMGACLCIRREALADVGTLDERFFGYFEDVDWCGRARARGWRVLYVPSARIVHHEGGSSARDARGASIAYYRSKLAYVRKHSRGMRRATFVALLLLEIALRRARAWLRAALPTGGEPQRLHRAAYRAAWDSVLAQVRSGA